jgi:hypothetical protein
MTTTLDWDRIRADIDHARLVRGLSWAGVADHARVPGYSVWRLVRGEGTVSASVLLPLMAWAGLNDLKRYVRGGLKAGEQQPAGAEQYR